MALGEGAQGEESGVPNPGDEEPCAGLEMLGGKRHRLARAGLRPWQGAGPNGWVIPPVLPRHELQRALTLLGFKYLNWVPASPCCKPGLCHQGKHCRVAPSLQPSFHHASVLPAAVLVDTARNATQLP